MTPEEALQWFNGTRSMVNLVTCDPISTWQERIEAANVVMLQQAYWVLKAQKKGLI